MTDGVAGSVESILSIVLLVALLWVIIKVAEGVPMVDFETQVDDAAEDAITGVFGGGQ